MRIRQVQTRQLIAEYYQVKSYTYKSLYTVLGLFYAAQ